MNVCDSMNCAKNFFFLDAKINEIRFYRQGLYPGKHGVLANDVYDMEQGSLKYSYELFHYSNETVPIWVSDVCPHN